MVIEMREGAGSFPGRWVGGVSLILAPILLLSGVLLRLSFDFFFPQQLAAFDNHPELMLAAYGSFIVGNVMLWPAIAALAQEISSGEPVWAVWGGTLVIFGLFARTFHSGVDHLAFQLVQSQGLDSATQAVGDAYPAFYALNTLNFAIMLGWLILAIGAFRSGILGLARSIALGAMSALMLGILKGSNWVSVLATVGLCVALVPLGVEFLRRRPAPERRVVVRWSLIVIGVALLHFIVGQLG